MTSTALGGCDDGTPRGQRQSAGAPAQMACRHPSCTEGMPYSCRYSDEATADEASAVAFHSAVKKSHEATMGRQRRPGRSPVFAPTEAMRWAYPWFAHIRQRRTGPHPVRQAHIRDYTTRQLPARRRKRCAPQQTHVVTVPPPRFPACDARSTMATVRAQASHWRATLPLATLQNSCADQADQSQAAT
ncbi:MAG: hypothetical protein ACI89X_003905 [Planctomycetota bacterium]|jgi:hypothetical protein